MTPDDTTRAAAERLRQHRAVVTAMRHPKESPYTYIEVSTGAAGFVPEAELKDMATVRRWSVTLRCWPSCWPIGSGRRGGCSVSGKRTAGRYDENGLPRDGRDWTEADWRTLWEHMRAVITEVGGRHGNATTSDASEHGRGSPTGRGHD